MTPKWAVGMRRLGPGVYVKDSVLHFDTEGLCRHLGIPHTEANARMVQQEAEKVIRDVFGPGIPVDTVA